MIQKITLENFKSFGLRQEIPLEPISVLVGPNNSGKSNLLTFPRFLANAMSETFAKALVLESGIDISRLHGPQGPSGPSGFASRLAPEAMQTVGRDSVLHRPPTGTGHVHFGWETDAGHYVVELVPSDQDVFRVGKHSLVDAQGHDAWTGQPDPGSQNSLARLRNEKMKGTTSYRSVCAPVLDARFVQLSLEALRKDAQVVNDPTLDSSGSGLAAVVGAWKGAQPEKAEMLESFVSKCIPTVRNLLVKPGLGTQGLWIRQNDNQEFDARHVSDGVLFCTALAAHIISAEKGTLIMVEEPELGIHPPLLHELAELIRTMVAEYGCQFVLTTHSRVLVNEFRDEPDAILRFRRTDNGTVVERASDVPALVEALESSTPGDLLESNLFNAV